MSDKTDRPTRCAIYTRKSTDEGLNQEFNSLDAQRDAGEAYILSQKASGWVCLPNRYDDGGFTGGNIERPALRRLVADIEAGRVDCVVVYKVDRLSRSLMDFARLMHLFEQKGVSFVSVTQHFNTTHSMGRLTLNILLSFAQFERELISERTRDKIAAARRKGKWAGGRPVLGYDLISRPGGGKLVVNDAEAERVSVSVHVRPEASWKVCMLNSSAICWPQFRGGQVTSTHWSNTASLAVTETVTPSSSGSLRLKLVIEKSPSGPSAHRLDRRRVLQPVRGRHRRARAGVQRRLLESLPRSIRQPGPRVPRQ